MYDIEMHLRNVGRGWHRSVEDIDYYEVNHLFEMKEAGIPRRKEMLKRHKDAPWAQVVVTGTHKRPTVFRVEGHEGLFILADTRPQEHTLVVYAIVTVLAMVLRLRGLCTFEIDEIYEDIGNQAFLAEDCPF